MNVQSVHHSLKHSLSDGDAIAVLHRHDGMAWRHPSTNSREQRIAYQQMSV